MTRPRRTVTPDYSASSRVRWTPEEDARLNRAFDEGASIDALARAHCRTRSAIEQRLIHLSRLSSGADDIDWNSDPHNRRVNP